MSLTERIAAFAVDGFSMLKQWGPTTKGTKRVHARKGAPWQERFWLRVRVGNVSECWEWQGSRGPHGHGAVRRDGKHIRATAIAWFLFHGEWPPEGMDICHHCDNPPCVNPAHLFIGTAKDNMQDAIRKGRFKFLRPRPGEHNNNAKLTWASVAEIRERYSAGENISQLSRAFRVARSTLREVVNGRNWRNDTVTPQPRMVATHNRPTFNRAEAVRLSVAGWTQSRIAEHLGVNQGTISRVLIRSRLAPDDQQGAA